MRSIIKKYSFSILIACLFTTVAFTLWLTLNNIFYLFNFLYIGGCITIGTILFTNKFKYARHCVQFAVGTYMLVYVGFMCNENMQIEGFWYFLFLGVFEGATIHYFVAKLFGPLFFSRGWCGFACWTAMILDMLPYKNPQNKERKKIGFIRYILFVSSLIFVSSLFLMHVKNLEMIMLISFIVGNILYYAVGIALAFAFKDNRAFCKYICPITVFLKPMSYFSVARVKVDQDKCISCGKCTRICPMEVDLLDPKRSRKNGTECILCMECIQSCPKQAIKLF